MDIVYFLKTTFKNLIIYGLFIAISLTVIEYINNNSKYIAFYAFLSASFFLVNLFQYYVINSIDKNLSSTFFIHSIIGGIIWVLYSVIIYIFHINNIVGLENMLYMFIIIIIISIIYYILLIRNNIFERFIKN